jgi:hypothetical protein
MWPTTFLCIIILQQSNEYYNDEDDGCITATMWTKEGKSDRRLEKLHNEELHDLYSSSNIIRTIKSRRMRWVGYIA